MSLKTSDVPIVSHNNGNSSSEVIDAVELAARWRVPASWVRNRTRARTPANERIPCIRLGRYVRFEWGSAPLMAWYERRRSQ